MAKIVIERTFDAPVEKVWQAWTDPTEMMKWWGPKDFTTPNCSIDLKVGGKYLYCMRSSDGKDYWGTGHYKEIVENKKIVWTDSFADKDGNIVSSKEYGMDFEIPLEMLVTIEFEETNGKTKMTLTHSGFPDNTIEYDTKSGWNESFDKLVTYLEGDN